MTGLPAYRTVTGQAVLVLSTSEEWVILDVEGAENPVQSIDVEFFDELILNGDLIAVTPANLTATDKNGVVTTYAYDSNRILTSAVQAKAGNTIATILYKTLNGEEVIDTITDRKLKVTTYSYTDNKLTATASTDFAGLFLGLSGFLPNESVTRLQSETRGWLRNLWEIWWKARGALDYALLPRTQPHTRK